MEITSTFSSEVKYYTLLFLPDQKEGHGNVQQLFRVNGDAAQNRALGERCPSEHELHLASVLMILVCVFLSK